MKIAVLIKQTPDTAELPKVSADEVRTGDVKAAMVINPWDEFAAEEAVRLDERFGAETVAITLGGPEATDALKHALAMGVAGAKRIDDSQLPDGDIWLTATLLAAAVQAEGEVDLVLTGKQSVDENSGSVHVGVAQKLGYPLLTNVVEIQEVEGGQVRAVRLVDGARETVQVPLPAVISVGKEINEPRYPSFMGIRKASRAQIPILTPEELGVAVPDSHVRWDRIRKPEERKTQVQIFDGATVEEKAAKLVDALLAEKVI